MEAQSDTSVSLSWTNAPGEEGFRIERSTENGAWSPVATVASGVTTYSDTGLSEATSYSYRVVATSSVGDSAPSASMSTVTLPSAPTGLAATVVSGGRIDLTWTNHSANASYTIEQLSDGSSGWQQVATPPDNATGCSVNDPFNGSTTYQFRVRATVYFSSYAGVTWVNSYSSAVSVTTPAFPSQPTLNSVTLQSDSSVVLTWSDVAGETGYRIERSTGNNGTWTSLATVGSGITTFTDTGLTVATSYTYRIVAINAEGDSAPSASRTVATQPSAPNGLTATAVSGGQINLSWTPHSTVATTYVIEQSTNGTTWTQVGSASGASANSYTATGPFDGSTTYQFRIHAYAYTGGNSTYATTSVSTPAYPSQPTLSSATARSDTSVALAWTDVAGETGYRIDRSTNNGSTWTTAGSVAAGFTTFTDTGLTEATSYTYRVVATNAAGDSAPSATRSTITLPSAPTGLTATAVSPTQINLSWTDHSSTASTYYIYIEQSTNGTTWTQIGTVSGTMANSYTAIGPFDGSITYVFCVNSLAYLNMNSTYVFSASATTSVTTPAYPTQPTLNSATAQSDTSVALAWTDVAGETGYRIDRSTNNGSTWTTAGTVGAGFTTFTDTGLTEATSYTYRILATNAIGDSAPSTTRTVATKPTAPTSLTATAVSGGQINLSWTDLSSIADYYYVEQSIDGSTWNTISPLLSGSTSAYATTGPFNGSTTYQFRVHAYAYTGGNSAYATASVSTPAYPCHRTRQTES